MLKLAILLAVATYVVGLPTSAVPDIESVIDPDGDWRIVGGSNAPTGAYPFTVSVRTAAGSHNCGGTIINNLNILTAAHCIIGRTTANTGILAGTNTLNSGGVARGSSRLIIHANYNSATIANDIGVIRLSSALSIGGNVQQVGLNTANTGAVNAILIGWGRLFTNGPIPNNLQHLATNTITHAQCQQRWGGSVSTLQICSLIASGQGSCQGDSGGPLIQSSNRAQLGIVSFGHRDGCAIGWPDVYVRVSSYINWISSAVAS